MRAFLFIVVSFLIAVQPSVKNSTTKYPQTMRLLLSNVGTKGGDFVTFAQTPAAAIKLLQQQTAYLYCLRLTKDKKNWRFFSPCGRIMPLFGSTLQVTAFPDIGKIEEVLSGRPLRFRKAVTLALSNIAPKEMPQAHPSSVKEFVETRLNEREQDIFIGIEVLRYGHL